MTSETFHKIHSFSHSINPTPNLKSVKITTKIFQPFILTGKFILTINFVSENGETVKINSSIVHVQTLH